MIVSIDDGFELAMLALRPRSRRSRCPARYKRSIRHGRLVGEGVQCGHEIAHRFGQPSSLAIGVTGCRFPDRLPDWDFLQPKCCRNVQHLLGNVRHMGS